MSSIIVVGGQYGSEGKGKVVALLAKSMDEPFVVRCGGPNSGHTVTINGEEIILRQVPAGAINPKARLFIAAGCAVNERVLINELDNLNIIKDRIFVDPKAVIINDKDIDNESKTLKVIGSTLSGTGAALIHRMTRSEDVCLAGDSVYLKKRTKVQKIAPILHSHLDKKGHVIIEGTQGFALSLLHGPDYPYCTSRDTTASGFAMEVGISPKQITNILMVIRTFPIKVGGMSGPLKNEISWEEVASLSKAPKIIPEYTSVTKRLRRVAQFDLELVETAAYYNKPTQLAIMGLDRLEYNNYKAKKFNNLSDQSQLFIRKIEDKLHVPVKFIGTGFRTEDVIVVRNQRKFTR